MKQYTTPTIVLSLNQTIAGDFKPLEKATTKVTGRSLDSAYEVYFSLYQQLVDDRVYDIDQPKVFHGNSLDRDL